MLDKMNALKFYFPKILYLGVFTLSHHFYLNGYTVIFAAIFQSEF